MQFNPRDEFSSRKGALLFFNKLNYMLNSSTQNATSVHRYVSINDAFLYLCRTADSATACTFLAMADSFRGVKKCFIRRECKHAWRVRLIGDRWCLTGAGDTIEQCINRGKRRLEKLQFKKALRRKKNDIVVSYLNH
jgi:hypothetical protein